MTPHPTSDSLDSRSTRENLCDGRLQFEAPSAAEMLTIAQCGYPRTYNLNDGMEHCISMSGL